MKDDFNAFSKPAPAGDQVWQLLGEFLGPDGIFVLSHGKGLGVPHLDASHPKWQKQRKTASKIFTKSAFSNHMLEVFEAKSDVMASTIARRGAEGEIDMQELFFRFTFDSISQIFFGRKVDTVSGAESDEYAKFYDTAHRNMAELYMGYAPVHVAAQELLPFPFGTWGDSGRSLAMDAVAHLTLAGRTFKYNARRLRVETLKLVQEARADPGLAERKDLLANFIKSDAAYSDQELCSVVLHHIIAGRDTSACALSWLFFELASEWSPTGSEPAAPSEVSRRVREEVLALGEVTYEKLLTQVPYLTGCIYEALRLHPPVAEDNKFASVDSEFDGVLIPAGTRVTFSNYAMGRNPEVYEDPLEFRPERWLSEDGSAIKLDTYRTPVFQAGYRECLGKDMAVLEIRCLAARLLKEFFFTIRPEEKANVSWSLTLTMAVTNAASGLRDSHELLLQPHAY